MTLYARGDMRTNLWTYWEGPMPRHIARCIESMRRSCSSACEFHLVTPANLGEYALMDSLCPRYAELTDPAHRADCIRALLLATHGGFYFDADTIGLRCPSRALVDGASFLYCCWDMPPRRVLNGYVYAAPGSGVAMEWLAKVNEALRSMPKDGMDWTALGEQVLTPSIDSQCGGAIEVPRSTFLPIDVDTERRDTERNVFFGTGEPETYIQDHTICFGLNNSWMMDKKPKEMAGIGTRTDLLIHKLFARYA